MIRPEQIPDEAYEAASRIEDKNDISAIILAAINAWPGMWHINAIDFEGKIILPLYKESTNAEG